MFLAKFCQNLPDEFLRIIFGYHDRKAVGRAVTLVRMSLMSRFVPTTRNIGLGAITRDEYIDQHVTPFANELYNPDPTTRKAIAIVYGTYVYA